MNAALLLEHYAQIADAPDAIARMRRFILDLAVRGKLVEQDTNDEPASETLGAVGIAECDAAAGVPGWAEAKVGKLLAFQYGKGLPANDRLDNGPIPVFGSNGIVGGTHTALTDRPAVIVGRKGSAGALNLCDGPSWTTDVAYFVEAPSFFLIQYLMLALAALNLDQLGKGVKPGLSRSDAYALDLCVPPLAEQHRIVAKFDELMALCDQLETAQAERETGRDKLTLSTLAKLNEPDPEAFDDDTRFALEHLEPLTKRTDQIKQLRQTILNLAVRGKLVEQNPADEPASELLKQIAVQKAKLGIKERHSPIALDETPFELPRSWVWSRIGGICTKTGSGSTPRGGKDVYKTSGVPFLRSQNVYNDGLRLNDVAFIEPSTHARMISTAVMGGDLLLNITGGSMGRCCRIPDDFAEANVSQHVAIIRPAVAGMVDFLHCLILSPYFQAFIFDEQTGAGRGGLPKNRMDKIIVALPPLVEQHRIVAKVSELMALCDQLEASLVEGEQTRSKLLAAVLHEALEPA